MSAISAEPVVEEKPKEYKAILWGGLLAGVLDITAACVNSALSNGRSPLFVLQTVASGVLGADSRNRGWASAALGLVIHFFIAFTAAAVYFAASRKLKFLVRQPWLWGVLYGIAVYMFMYMVVIPITFSRKFNAPLSAMITPVLIHIFCVGLPIALMVKRFSAASLALPLLMLLMLTPLSAPQANANALPQQNTETMPVVLVELFTSEGCSSCPPADKLLADLEGDQMVKGVQVIAISEHVDYWNRLGWKDPFSAAEFSKRQLDYMQALGLQDVYTPQMIVDGRTQFVGSNLKAAREAIANAARAPKASISLVIKTTTQKSLRLAVQIDNLPEVTKDDTLEVMLALTESDLLSNVSRGENKGRNLLHAAVARKLINIGKMNGKTFQAEKNVDLDSTWKRKDMKVVAFVQERASKRILGAKAIKLAAEL
jgi:hypothetical protein